MDDQDTTRLVKHAYERFSSGDVESFLNSLHPDIVWQWISIRYGSRTADFVAMQLEYPRPFPFHRAHA